MVVTADAMHAQVERAHFLVAAKGADHVFVVKDNEPDLKEALGALD
jgi:hypothetical protein